MYSLSLNINGQLYESKGDSMYEALTNLPQPPKMLAKGILKLKKGESEKTLLLMPRRLKRLWMKGSPTFLGKYFDLLLK